MNEKLESLKRVIGDPKGKCYIVSEVAQKILGSEKWKPCQIYHEGVSHWYLQNKESGEILDLTSHQFDSEIDYSRGRGRGFLTKDLSKKSRELLRKLDEFIRSRKIKKDR